MPKLVPADGEYTDGEAVTPSDVADLAKPARALWIGSVSGGATLRITTPDGNTLNLVGVPVGILKISAVRVHSTGTLVSSIVALR